MSLIHRFYILVLAALGKAQARNMYLVHPPVSHPYARQVLLTIRSGPHLLEQCCQIELPAMTEMFYICIVCLFVFKDFYFYFFFNLSIRQRMYLHFGFFVFPLENVSYLHLIKLLTLLGLNRPLYCFLFVPYVLIFL